MREREPWRQRNSRFVGWRDVTLCIALETEKRTSRDEGDRKIFAPVDKGLWRQEGWNTTAKPRGRVVCFSAATTHLVGFKLNISTF